MYKYCVIAFLFLNQSFLDAQVYIDTIFSSQTEIIIKTDRFDNCLNPEDTVVFTEPMISTEGVTFLPSTEYLIFNMIDKEKFFVFLNGKQIYEGEGSWKFEEGRQIYNSAYEWTEGSVIEGNLEGTLVSYNYDLRDTLFIQYAQGIRHGPTISKNGDNHLIYYCQYTKGLKNGLEYALHSNQMIKFFNRYTNGKIDDGIYYGYDGEGNIIYKKVAVDGKTSVEYY